MKKKLLKPPSEGGQILSLPDLQETLGYIKEDSRVGVCHQPYFFNPGVSLKFLFLDDLQAAKKNIIFLDTDRVKIGVKVPFADGSVRTLDLIRSKEVLSGFSTPDEELFYRYFDFLEEQIVEAFRGGETDVYENLLKFKEIIFRNMHRGLLKEVLVESFLEFYDMEAEYTFVSDLVCGEEFKRFFDEIYNKGETFRRIFNETLVEYKREFRFRYKNYPFPELEDGELPFWIIKEGKRGRCFKRDLDAMETDSYSIFPRAVTLTIFLRLYLLDVFIHGIGGANYEWIQDRIIERFFKKEAPFYGVLSGTFLLGGFKEREFPYFLFNPQKIRKSLTF